MPNSTAPTGGRTVSRWIHALLFAAAALLDGHALALTKGQVVTGSFKDEYGGALVLPPGQWQVLDSWNAEVARDASWHVSVLQNLDPRSPTPVVIFRVNPVSYRGNAFACDSVTGKATRLAAFPYGTKGVDINNKCTEVWSAGTLNEFKNPARIKDSLWWRGIFERVADFPAAQGAPLLLATTEMRRLNRFVLHIDTFIRPASLDESLPDLANSLKAGASSGPSLRLAQWLRSQTEMNEQSFYEGAAGVLEAMSPAQPGHAVAATRPQEQVAQAGVRPAAVSEPRPAPATPSAPVVYANRRALVIGNDSYRHVQKLANAREDARAIADGLRAVGYQVTLRLDVDQAEMKSALRAFKAQVQGGDEVAIFYAGHGVQLGNTNYLLPVDIVGESEDQIKDDAVPLQRILDDLEERKAKFTLAMIDACRDNPFKTSGRSVGATRGLSPTTAATGQMIVFSAGNGQQALDNLGPADRNKNSVFTRAFLKELEQPGVPVDQVIKRVRMHVVAMAKSVGREQVPAIYDQVIGEFYFKK